MFGLQNIYVLSISFRSPVEDWGSGEKMTEVFYFSCLAAALKHPRTPPTNPSVDFLSGDPEHISKRTMPMGISDEVNFSFHLADVKRANPSICSHEK